ncbi:alpha-L-arabinofuranosidase C-terminal domain-containing protein [Streptomyces canus]|uniref:alpha-L-arabinofuranosidase C-terminal domain-containing protein n=1 Tax=Streptomyces canus TaxID=58343 RepID=UPI00035C7852|nr:alpha-L-arabinofuranosidase C-terminal domain-containing protein [Streptomyces canus]
MGPVAGCRDPGVRVTDDLDQRTQRTPAEFLKLIASTTVTSPTPDLNAALGDAAWLAGLIRNSDQVLMECYAPLFSHVRNRLGDTVLPATARALPGLATVATRAGNRLYVAVVNSGTQKVDVPVELKGLVKGVRKHATATVLTGPSRTTTNTLTDPAVLVPRTSTVTGAAAAFTSTLPPLSVTVLELVLT